MTPLIPAILTASIPTLMVVLALVLNRTDTRDLRVELRNEIAQLRSQQQVDMAELRAQQHRDMLRIYELFGEHGERIIRVETVLANR